MGNVKRAILIVEDDITLLDTLGDFLSKDFERVVKAVDGISAYIAVEEIAQNLEIIFTDIKMPGWDGLQFVTNLRAQGVNTPVLFTSGTADRDDLIKALRLGAVDFVPKPYNLEEIRTAIFRVLEISRRETEIAVLQDKHGKENNEVIKQNRMVGLFRTANVKKKLA